MFPRQAFTSALHVFVVFAFFSGGLFCSALPYLPEIRAQMIAILAEDGEPCTLIGAVFFAASFLFFSGFYALNRGRYLVIRMGASADVKIIRQTVEECFHQHFPEKMRLKDLAVGPRNSLQFQVHLTPIEEADREELLAEAQEQLTLLLQKRFGYAKPFYFIVKV